MNKWISVKDRLPDHNQYVLIIRCIGGKFFKPNVAKFKWNKFYPLIKITGLKFNSENITHWMPLPEPPNI